jgi:transposase-like protein
MSDTFSKVEVITGVARRRRFSTEFKLAVVAETMQPGMSVSYVARRHGLSPSLIFRWRQLMSEGGKEAVRADDEVVAASEVRRLEERVRELERLLGRKTMEVELLKEALDLARAKKPMLLSRSPLVCFRNERIADANSLRRLGVNSGPAAMRSWRCWKD